MHPHTNISPRQTGHTETTKPSNLKLLSEDSACKVLPGCPQEHRAGKPPTTPAVLHLLLSAQGAYFNTVFSFWAQDLVFSRWSMHFAIWLQQKPLCS